MKLKLTILMSLLLMGMAVMADETATTGDKPKAPRFASLAEAQEAAAKDGRTVVIDFYTDWCTWCKRFDTLNLVQQPSIDFFSKEAALVQINAEVDTAMARKYSVMGYPTFVVLDASGNEIDRLSYLVADEYIETVRNYKNGIGTLGAMVEQAKADTSRMLAYEIAGKYSFSGKSDESENWFNKVIAVNGKDSLAAESKLAVADMYMRKKLHAKAVEAFGAVATEFTGTMFEETADIMKAVTYRRAADTTNAIAAFEAFIQKHPKSEDVEYAQKQIEKLKGTTAEAGK